MTYEIYKASVGGTAIRRGLRKKAGRINRSFLLKIRVKYLPSYLEPTSMYEATYLCMLRKETIMMCVGNVACAYSIQ